MARRTVEKYIDIDELAISWSLPETVCNESLWNCAQRCLYRDEPLECPDRRTQ